MKIDQGIQAVAAALNHHAALALESLGDSLNPHVTDEGDRLPAIVTSLTMSRLTSSRLSVVLFTAAWIIFSPAGVVFCEGEVRSSDQPDVVKERARKELEEQGKPKEKEKPVVPAPPEPERPAIPPGPRFFVEKIVLQGNQVIPPAELEPRMAPYQGRESSLKDLQELSEIIQKEYRSRGYFTTVVYLPPQSVAQGKVVIQVLEGRFGGLDIQGQRYFGAAQIRRLWGIPEGRVLRYQEMSRALQRLNANPDREVRALLRAGETLGTTDAVLKVKDRFPVRPGLFLDNQGTKAIGRERLGFSLRHSNLSGRDDNALVGLVGGEHFGVGFAQYSLPFGEDRKSQLILSATHAQTSPKRQFKPLGVNGTSETYTAALAHSFLDSEKARLDVRAGLDLLESRTKVLSGTSRRDRLRVIRLTSDGRRNDAGGLWRAEPELSFGLKGLGASSEDNPVASRSGAAPDFIKARLNVTRIQRMPWATQAILNVEGQMSTSKLTPQEQLSLGGAASIRGYPEGDYLADQGVVARFDYIVPARWIPHSWRLPGFGTILRDALQLIGFIDRGYGRLRAVTGGEFSSRNPMGVGVGIGIQEMRGFTLRLEWGFSVGDPPVSDDSRHAFHFRIRRDF